MKTISHNLSIGAAVACAVLFFAPSPASSDGLTDFLGKFNPAEPCDWSGVYLGLNVGGSWNQFDMGDHRTDVDLAQQFYELLGDTEEESIFTTFHAPGHEDTQSQVIGGMQAGVNFQFGHFVFGGEGSFIGNVSQSTKRNEEFQENDIFLITEEEFVTAETLFHDVRTAEMLWNGFVGGRIGYCWNRFLFYGTGGASFARVDVDSTQRADTAFFGFIGDGTAAALAAHTKTTQVANAHPAPQQEGSFLGEIVNTKNRSESDLLTGYYGGVGTEYKLTNNVSVGVEYRHVDWGNNTANLAPGPNNGPVFPGDFDLGLTGDQVVFKVNIMVAHFNPFH